MTVLWQHLSGGAHPANFGVNNADAADELRWPIKDPLHHLNWKMLTTSFPKERDMVKKCFFKSLLKFLPARQCILLVINAKKYISNKYK